MRTEEIFHEEDPLRVLRRLEHEGWMKYLFPALSAAKANVAELERLRASQTQLELQGIHPETAAANFPLLTAKLSPKDVSALKASFPRRGFVAEIAALEKDAKEFAAQFTGKGAATPSQAWKLLHSSKPEAVLWTAHTSKAAAAQNKFKAFYTDWPQAKLKLPYALMQEMRIVPGVPRYEELLENLFFELMDGKLTTVEEMKAYLEPYSPPAPPPPVHLRRPRAAKKDAKPAKKKKEAVAEGEEVLAVENGEGAEAAEVVKPVKAAKAAPAKAAAVEAPAKVAGKKAVAAPAKSAAKPEAKKAAAKIPEKKVVAKAPAKKAVAKKLAAPAKKAPAKKAAAKAPVKKAVVKKAAAPAKKVAAKKAVAKKAPAKAAAKKKR